MKCFALILVASCCFAQPDSRSDEIAAEQQKKAAQVRPPQQGRIEHGLLWLREQELVDRIFNNTSGFSPRFGGLAPEAGIGLGAGYTASTRAFTYRAGAVASFKGSRKFDAEIVATKFLNSRVFADIHAVRHNYFDLSYYGSGPESEKGGRTRYHLEDKAVDGRIGVRPFRNFTAGASLGYVTTEAGLYGNSNYTRVGTFAQYDSRDNPGGPRSGGNYFAQFSDYRKFRRMDLEGQHFFSILNQRRVFALRAKWTQTFKDSGELIPFYMQPALGSSDDLRGFRPYRFRGDNLMVMNAEYRWEVFSGLDMALFADAGKVYTHKSEFNLHHLESDAGFGFRFNARNKTFLRLDTGFSHEGFQIWLKFNNAFQKGPLRSSSGVGDF